MWKLLSSSANTWHESLLDRPSTRRKVFVIDLDETLIHAVTKRPYNNGYDFEVDVNIDRYVTEKFYVKKRPYVDQFLNTVRKWYDLVIFTASIQPYANAILRRLDPTGTIFLRRYYYNHCISRAGRCENVKDLTIVQKDLRNVFILDDRKCSSWYNPENALPIDPFYGDSDDDALLCYLPFLRELRFVDDVRPNIVELQRKYRQKRW